MKLKIGKGYRIYMPDGEHRGFFVIRLTVISDEDDGWYKVDSGGEVFFLNLKQAIKVYED
jgi:hypothetical protein